VLLLVGGGLSLGTAIESSGLAAAFGAALGGVATWPAWALLGTVALITAALSHVTSNTATTAALVPLAAGLAATAGLPVVGVGVAVALGASAAFLLPVATPPNAIVFASERLRVKDMIRGGAGLVVGGCAVATLAAWLLAPTVLR
jgi:sodium-dependent dicarboxylate transporter 2/3/5